MSLCVENFAAIARHKFDWCERRSLAILPFMHNAVIRGLAGVDQSGVWTATSALSATTDRVSRDLPLSGDSYQFNFGMRAKLKRARSLKKNGCGLELIGID